MLNRLAAIPRVRLLVLLAVSITFSLLLVYARIQYTHSIAYLFFAWNLILAIIPFAISAVMVTWKGLRNSVVLFIPLFLTWLVFLPNAPYMLTDLFHLKIRMNVPLWYDLILMLSFALNGLVICFVSLMDMQEIIREKFGKFISWSMAFLVLLLSGLGIYLGRYLRWNSWDIIDHPLVLLEDLSERLLNPSAYPQTWGMTLMFAVFLTLGYLIFRELGNQKLLQRSKA